MRPVRDTWLYATVLESVFFCRVHLRVCGGMAWRYFNTLVLTLTWTRDRISRMSLLSVSGWLLDCTDSGTSWVKGVHVSVEPPVFVICTRGLASCLRCLTKYSFLFCVLSFSLFHQLPFFRLASTFLSLFVSLAKHIQILPLPFFVSLFFAASFYVLFVDLCFIFLRLVGLSLVP